MMLQQMNMVCEIFLKILQFDFLVVNLLNFNSGKIQPDVQLHQLYIQVYGTMKMHMLTVLFPGLLNQPKWGHLKDLHAVIKLCEPALVAVDDAPQYVKLGPKQEVCKGYQYQFHCRMLLIISFYLWAYIQLQLFLTHITLTNN